jgi:hypothetical protein
MTSSSERDGQPPARRLLSGQLVLAPSKVLDQAMAANDHPGGTVLVEAAHRPQLRREAAMVGLDPVVGVLLGAMPCNGSSSSNTAGYTGARSVVISAGLTLVVPMARSKKPVGARNSVGCVELQVRSRMHGATMIGA